MINYYKSIFWTNYEKKYGPSEWNSITMNAIKKESKRNAFYRTLNKWDAIIEKKKGQLARNEKTEDDFLSINLVKWNIKYHYAYKFEQNNLSRYQWKFICSFRAGHIELNAQKKFGFASKLCENCDNNTNETIIHFVFECNKYIEERKILFENILELWNSDIDLDIERNANWNDLRIESKLKYLFFPYQWELYNDSIRTNKEKRIVLLNKRIKIIKHFVEFIKSTNRFKITYGDTQWSL